MSEPAELYWLDYETTGLRERQDTLLEVAVAVAPFHDPFTVRHIYHAVFHFAGKVKDPIVREMHAKNGLLADCIVSKLSIWEAEVHLLQLVPDVEDKDARPILAGSTISFDQRFMAEHMPLLAKRFSYRLFDVNGIKLYCRARGMPKIQKGEAHRAKADIEESVAHGMQCEEWLEAYFKNGRPAPSLINRGADQ